MILKLVGIAIVVGVLAGFLAVRFWMNTPHGRLDPRAAILLKVIDLRGVDLFAEGRSPAEVRAFSKKNGAPLKARPAPVREVFDGVIPGPAGKIPVRYYRAIQAEACPLLVYFHGGGWVMGDLDTHDNLCRLLARKSDALVMAVDYRLAPEHPFPAPFDDAYAAVVWAAENAASVGADPERILVAGDSAGANLAAAVCLAARDRGGPAVHGQVLAYPATDLASFDRPSYAHFADGHYLTRRYMEQFRDRYLPRVEDRTDPLASPLLAPDLTGLPPTLVITAGFDVLRDEGEAYAQRLQDAGVPVTASRYDGMVHGFLSMDRVFSRQTAQATDEIASFVRAGSSK